MKEEILRLENVIKEENGIKYLDNINLYIFKGEIMGLLPLDNHGKKQLINLIMSNLTINFGRIYFNDELRNYYEYSDLSFNKVYTINKETKLIEDLKVVDNMFILNNNFTNYIINENNLKKQTLKVFEQVDVSIDVDQYISELTLYEKKVIELIKAIINGSLLIILDELSSFLSVEELNKFQKLILYYKNQGISFLYMANHHEEAFKICDRISLLENGRIIKILDKENFNLRSLNPYILDFERNNILHSLKSENSLFEFKNFKSKNLKDFSFSVNKGECLTILDLNNRGIQDIIEIINGIENYHDGTMLLKGKPIDYTNIENMIENKIIFVPENPTENMLFYDMTYMENLTFFIDRKLKRSFIKKSIIESIKIEYKNIIYKNESEQDIYNLDAKDLYELVYLKILLYNPEVVFIFQPFSYADMYIRKRIIELIYELKNKGIAVIILAVNKSDTHSVSDKYLIMEKGNLVSIK